MVQPITLLVKKYFNNNLKALAKIIKLSKQNGFAYYHEIKKYLNRERNQVSTILGKLENDNLITRDKDHRPQKIFPTLAGKELLKKIVDLLS